MFWKLWIVLLLREDLLTSMSYEQSYIKDHIITFTSKLFENEYVNILSLMLLNFFIYIKCEIINLN